MIRNRILSLPVVMTGLLAVPTVWTPRVWAQSDYGDMERSFDSFGGMVDSARTYLGLVLAPGSPGAQLSQAVFLTIAVYVISMSLAKWMMAQTDTWDLMASVFLVVLVKIILSSFDTLTEAAHHLATGLGSSIQEPIVGTADVFFPASYISNLISNFSYLPVNIFEAIATIMGTIVLSAAGLALGVVAFFTAAWGTWGYAVAKLVGWFFVPFLLVPRLAFLFDGWLRFFVGFLVYDVLARVNISLCLVLLSKYFGLPLSAAAVSSPIVISGSSLSDYFGLLALMIMALVALIATGRFAVTIASGVGGFGGIVSTVAYGAARLGRGMR